MRLTPHLPSNATAKEVVAAIAADVVPPGWEMTFAHFDTAGEVARKLERERTPAPLAWRMGWAGLVEEAETGDLEKLLNRLTAHTVEVEAAGRQFVSREDVPRWLTEMQAAYPPEGDISLLACSRVMRRGPSGIQVRHIPMMDFRCGPSDRSRHLVVLSMRKLGQTRGVVLESGKSYHYYGFELLSEEGWRQFMHRALLLTPFVDPRYIGHRLLADTARLRITASRGKPTIPRVVADLGGTQDA